MLPETDGGSQGNEQRPGGNAGNASQQGAGGSTSDSDFKRAVETLRSRGFEVVEVDEFKDMKRIYGSVKLPDGNIAKKLAKLDTLETTEKNRSEQLPELERLREDRGKLAATVEQLSGEVTQYALQVGLLRKNLERAHPTSEKEAVLEPFLDTNLLSGFKGGDEDAEVFLDGALDKMVENQRKVANLFRPKEGTPGSQGPASATAARGDRIPRMAVGSVMQQGMNWKDGIKRVDIKTRT